MDEKAIRLLVWQQRAIQLLYFLLHAAHVLIVLQLPRLQYNAFNRVLYIGGLGSALLTLYVTLYLSASQAAGTDGLTDGALLEGPQNKDPQQGKFCYYCRREFPRGWDHHCVFIGTCVARHNHRIFWLFLIVQWVGIVATFHFIFTARSTDLPLPNSWKLDGKAVLFQCFCLLGLLLWLFFVGSLLAFHTVLAVTGLTSRDVLKSGPCTGFPTPTGALATRQGRQTLCSRMPKSVGAAMANFVGFITADGSQAALWLAQDSSCCRYLDKAFDNDLYSCC
ncbi:DHHC palmitoyltransferase-domain-containing protein [Dunaliella salina]|uniref:S-acyltransferase n=1 Tax=Dunaliella salina TaxID=3046 RepID=A0ABQ7GK13_DUNSA|nr:DHHC palmitoyltransferase-domain-containing protein [Dunaliella salina]|eukprot:KAF5834962.1 DHHC palmitoyltransferase-domain-containing protein [Dunaliella salina]